MYYPDYINYFKERIIESNNLDQIKWRAKFTRNNRNKRMLNLNGINHTFLNTMECKKRLVEIAPQVWRIALSLREGVVFQSRSTSNVSTHLLEASPIPINEPFWLISRMQIGRATSECSPSSLINNARINFAIRSRYRKRDPPCFETKLPGDIQVATRVLNFESANRVPPPPCFCPFIGQLGGNFAIFPSSSN